MPHTEIAGLLCLPTRRIQLFPALKVISPYKEAKVNVFEIRVCKPYGLEASKRTSSAYIITQSRIEFSRVFISTPTPVLSKEKARSS